MPVIIDIKEDARYQQGVEEGLEQKAIDTARRMFENGLDFSLVQNITGLKKLSWKKLPKAYSNPDYLASGIQTVISVLPRLAQA